VDVEWQDGTVSQNILSTDLFPCEIVGDNDFLPNDFILSRDNGSLGVIVKVNTQERICQVQWLETPPSSSITTPTTSETKEPKTKDNVSIIEDVSLYNIESHPHMEFRLSGIVISLPDHAAIEASASAEQKSWCGQLMSVNLDKLTIKWSDGHTSVVGPQQIYPIDDEEDDFIDENEFEEDDEEEYDEEEFDEEDDEEEEEYDEGEEETKPKKQSKKT